MAIRSIGFKDSSCHFKVRDEELFIACCKTREQYEMTETPSALWIELATKFQEAKGTRPSTMAAYCMRKAGRQ